MDTQTALDTSGSRIFCTGDFGAVHVMAHRMLDSERYELGYRWLRVWLERRDGDDSDWVHIQWHMLVFELALGEWDAAFDRFNEHILPAAEMGDACTDAPAGLWRLCLSAPSPAALPWRTVHSVAISELPDEPEPFVELHHLLALAGARDIDRIDDWLARSAKKREPLTSAVRGLRAFAVRDFRTAVMWLDIAIPQLHELGGSRAQNELFCWIRDRATDRISNPGQATKSERKQP